MAPEIEVRHPLELLRVKDAYASMKAIAEDGEYGLQVIKKVFTSIFRSQSVDIEVQTDSFLAEKEDGMWHPNAAIVGASLCPETDEHEYKSLMVPADLSKKPPPMRLCKGIAEVLKKVEKHSKEINAMLNHQTGGTVHFGIQDEGNIVEEGLDFDQDSAIDKLQMKVGQLLQGFDPAVQTRFVTIKPVNLLNSTGGETGRWRFDFCVSPYGRVVFLSRTQTVAYYRQGASSEQMPADLMKERFRSESENAGGL